jgi:hypothetical protein
LVLAPRRRAAKKSVVWLAVVVSGCGALARPLPESPLEANGYARPSTVAEISAYLETLDRRDARAAHVAIGQSAGGRPIDALLLASDPDPLLSAAPPGARLRVMILGSQHGTEASGAEAILILAGRLLGRQAALLDELELVLVPVGNPDGREAHRRVNASGVNLSTDFTVLSQPESRALLDALERWQPDVFLDVHESAVFKRQSLAAQGYMTDVEAQLEIGNNPNVDAGITAFSREDLRPAMLGRVRARGLDAESYVGEITDVAQPITHGGVTIKNLRNRAAMNGIFSFLVENRLDPAAGSYPTPRNIRARAEKQLLCLEAFLAVCRAEREAIRARVRNARAAWANASAEERETLFAAYAPDPGRTEIRVRLRRISDGQTEERALAYHGRVLERYEIELPAAYAVTEHGAAMRVLLDRQHIHYEALPGARRCRVTAARVRSRRRVPGRHGWGYWQTEADEREVPVTLAAGTLWVPLRQPARRLIPLLLELGSNSSFFEHPDYAPLVVPGEDFFVYRVRDDCREGA